LGDAVARPRDDRPKDLVRPALEEIMIWAIRCWYGWPAKSTRWLENPYYQFFCGELSFCHQLPFDRSSLTHWRQRLGRRSAGGLDPGKPVGGA
jgi:hypothetical protein